MSVSGANGARPRVLVLGGGFGGLETSFYLRQRAGDALDLTLVSDRDDFVFKPNSIYVPFGLDPAKLLVPLAKPAAKRGIRLVRACAEGIDPAARRVETDGPDLDYDFLVVATGSGMRPEEVPGLSEHSLQTWTPEDMLRLRAGFEEAVEAGKRGERTRIVFTVPANNKCAGPLYEIVLMLETWLRKRGVRDRVEITWTTFEHTYIQAFGPRLHEVVSAEFERRGITGLVEHAVERVEPGEAVFANGEAVGYDLLVSFPPYVAAAAFAGLPADERGFLRTEPATREVSGHPEIFAAGDAGDFPVKQAFLAFLQADAVAEQIAARALGGEAPAGFDPISMCVMEQFDKATFAKVPLRVTGDPEHPVEVRPGAGAEYRVGSSLPWRGGKKLLGLSVPWRFANGRPFHGGPFWTGMDAGLRVMSAALSSGAR